jgi:23S rRNA pseudouridine1911/1915/1917 synthase
MAGREVTFAVAAEKEGERLDKVILVHAPELSRGKAQQLIQAGAVMVNGCPCKPSYRVKSGDQVTATLPEEPKPAVRPEPIPLDVVHEDDHLLVVNKPAGMVVHPAPGHPGGTLVNAVLACCPQVADVGRPDRAGLIHRLDKETSGLIVVAKDEATLVAMQRQFRRRKVAKTYLALVEGQVQPREGIVEVPLGRDRRHRQKMTVERDGKEARTMYCVVEAFDRYTLLEVHPYTGRMHQVRVHLAWLGYPVVGDTVYGRRRQRLLQERHFLHAAQLCFTHPATGEEVTFKAPLPVELFAVLEHLQSR